MFNKFLIPPPVGNDRHLFINVSFNIREIVYINEEQQFIRTKKEVFKEWFNSYLTFQNLKQDATNLINSDDRNLMWFPGFSDINVEDKKKCIQTKEVELLKVVPHKDFKFSLNSYTEPLNAFLFKVVSTRPMVQLCQAPSNK